MIGLWECFFSGNISVLVCGVTSQWKTCSDAALTTIELECVLQSPIHTHTPDTWLHCLNRRTAHWVFNVARLVDFSHTPSHKQNSSSTNYKFLFVKWSRNPNRFVFCYLKCEFLIYSVKGVAPWSFYLDFNLIVLLKSTGLCWCPGSMLAIANVTAAPD